MSAARKLEWGPPAESTPKLKVLAPPVTEAPANAAGDRAADKQLMFAMLACCVLFAIAFGLFILLPASRTLFGL